MSDSSSPQLTTVTGSCLCGKIQYTLNGAPTNNVLCFCNSCRKVTGSLGITSSWYSKNDFTITSGQDEIKFFKDTACDSGGSINRAFCALCGSTMISENELKFPGQVIVPAGTMDIDFSTNAWVPKAEYYCKRKAPWINTPEETQKFVALF